MAQLNKKYLFIVIAVLLIFFVVFAMFKLPISSVETTDKKNYLVSLDGQNYSQKVNLSYGTYIVYVKTPLFQEKIEVDVKLFDNIKLDISSFATEGGIEKVARINMISNGFPGTEVNKCIELGKLYYVCESYQLSSTRAVELIYKANNWTINIDPGKSQTPKAKEEMIKINQNNNQR